MNDINFDKNGLALIEENFQGINLEATTLDWHPYVYISDCNYAGKNCKYQGFLIDLMNIWGKNLNFTLTIYQDKKGDWGTTPKSGTFRICTYKLQYMYTFI